jgi:hypothetical protein
MRSSPEARIMHVHVMRATRQESSNLPPLLVG